jgi:hypothetical protein
MNRPDPVKQFHSFDRIMIQLSDLADEFRNHALPIWFNDASDQFIFKIHDLMKMAIEKRDTLFQK